MAYLKKEDGITRLEEGLEEMVMWLMNGPGQIRESLLKSLKSISFYSGMSEKDLK